MEGVDVFELQRTRVGEVVVRAQRVHVEQGQTHAGDGRFGPPHGGFPPRDEARGHDGDDGEVEQVWRQQIDEGVVQVRVGVLGGAEETVRQHGGAVAEVEEAGVERLYPRAQGVVRGREPVEPEGGETREEDVIGDLQAGRGEGEDVLRGEEGQAREEGDESRYCQDVKSAANGRRRGPDGHGVCRCCADGSIVGHCLGEEHWSEEEEERLDAETLSVIVIAAR